MSKNKKKIVSITLMNTRGKTFHLQMKENLKLVPFIRLNEKLGKKTFPKLEPLKND